MQGKQTNLKTITIFWKGREQMKKGSLITIFLVFTLMTLLIGFFYLESANAKKNEQTLVKSIENLYSENESLQNQVDGIVTQNKTLSREVDSLKKEIESLQKEKQILTKKNNELKSKQEEYLKKIKNIQPKQIITQTSSASSEKNTSGDNKIAYLTFDDGPSNNTLQILDILKKEKIKGTFFVTGKTDDFSMSTYKKIINEGHSIGNHSYSHDYSYIYKNEDNFFKDFNKLNDLIYKTTGVVPSLFRFPGGSNNQVSWKYSDKNFTKKMSDSLKNKNIPHIDWNVDSTDASVVTQDKDRIVKSVLENAKRQNQIVVLMHDSKPKTTTVAALPQIISGLRSMGYTFEAVSKDSFHPQFIKQ